LHVNHCTHKRHTIEWSTHVMILHCCSLSTWVKVDTSITFLWLCYDYVPSVTLLFLLLQFVMNISSRTSISTTVSMTMTKVLAQCQPTLKRRNARRSCQTLSVCSVRLARTPWWGWFCGNCKSQIWHFKTVYSTSSSSVLLYVYKLMGS